MFQHACLTFEKFDRGGGDMGIYCDRCFPIYAKGNGIVCMEKKGFEENEFLVEYFGEVYPAWRWYEKCDRMKTVEAKLSQENKVPDFYNIVLERHR